jgi:hypothetical protein
MLGPYLAIKKDARCVVDDPWIMIAVANGAWKYVVATLQVLISVAIALFPLLLFWMQLPLLVNLDRSEMVIWYASTSPLVLTVIVVPLLAIELRRVRHMKSKAVRSNETDDQKSV